jgi:phenylpyruvate tautomerase PptA (4-oxalocrotonate tautomerase family)
MPMIDLTLPKGALTEEAKAMLLKRLTTTVAKWEGIADDPRALQTIWAFLDERDPSAMTVGGEPVAAPRYRVRVTLAAGALDDQRKAGLVADATQAVLEAEGAANEPANAARVWCHIHELPDGNWGAVGRIWRLRDVAELVGVDFPGLRHGQLSGAP